jgi:diacylglycerol kinase family enzyme
VLIMNLRSGGGKATHFHLQEHCSHRGIEAIVLQPGDDLVALAERAVDRGADVLGMAGGDGSQALVAGVAARRGVAMVVVPAGTRNHLALDLGLDRDDVVGALDAFGEAVEQSMDLAEVNGRVFVTNVSLGLYAAIVRSPEYRDAKVDTTLSALPSALGPGSRPFDLRFTGPDGEPHDGTHILQISNNPYVRLPSISTTRPHLIWRVWVSRGRTRRRPGPSS